MLLRKRSRTAVKPVIGLLIMLSPVCAGWADGAIGTVTHLQGTLSVQHADGGQALLAVESPVQEKDVLSTAANTYARIKFADSSETVLRPESTLSVENFSYPQSQPENGNILLNLLKGGLRKVTGFIGHAAPEKDVLTTPVATIGIRGTHLGMIFCQGDCGRIPTVSGEPLHDGLHLDVVEGKIEVKNPSGSIEVAAGEFGYVQEANIAPKLVRPHEGVQITIPPSIMQNSSTGKTLDVDHSDEQCTVQ